MSSHTFHRSPTRSLLVGGFICGLQWESPGTAITTIVR